MRFFELTEFGLENLQIREAETPEPGPGQVKVRIQALSLNYRDILVIRGHYNPKLKLPTVPISDAAGVVEATGEGVLNLRRGDRVMSHFISGWQEGRYRGEYLSTTLGTPGPGLAAEEIVLPETALVPCPEGYEPQEAATLPIAALTAWSALVTEGRLEKGQTVLTLGTGGVSIFALQIAKAMGATVIITSSSHEKLERARALGADVGIHYVEEPAWEKKVLEATSGRGVDVVVENGGAKTLTQSLKATAAGGTVALLGALTGLQAEINIAPIPMKRIRVAGVLVDSRAAFEKMVDFLSTHRIRPVIDRTFDFEELPAALEHMAGGRHFGKIVVRVG
ncbi:MAG: NAD(P)-dependent alcohol dehydrogenase [Planctomycetota bacterium]